MSDLKLGVLGYIPPRTFGHVEAWLQNLRNHPTKHPLMLYSWERRGEAGVIPLRGNPESARGKKGNVDVNNAVFYTSILIAHRAGLTHMLYLEEDCRVGCEGWDDILWQEFLSKNPEAYAGGTPVVFNPCSWSREASEAWERFLVNTKTGRHYPISVAGNSRLAERQQACVFVNGALAIYDVRWLMKIFGNGLGNIVHLAQTSITWDYEIGIRLWGDHQEKSYDKIVCLTREFSGYGDLITTEDERKSWLIEKKFVAVHQIKSNWIGPVVPKAEESVRPVKPAIIPENKKAIVEAVFTPLAEPEKRLPTPKVEIMIVTFLKDVAFLVLNLRSIRKFAKGFAGVTVVVPDKESPQFETIAREFDAKVCTITERPGKGFLAHMIAVCKADTFCEADYILHTDADCMFKEEVHPEDYFKDGKPILLCRPYSNVRDQNHAGWKVRAERALGFAVTHDFMVRHPAVHHREVYSGLRQHMLKLHMMPFEEWVYQQQNAFPQGFAEFPTLGAYADKTMREKYSIIDIKDGPEPDNKLVQGWSKEGVDQRITFKDGVSGTQRERASAILGPALQAV